MTEYVLEILDGDRAHETIPLGEQTLSIGRRPGNDLSLADEKVSGKHAEVALEEGSFVLRDLGSTNGTYIDGRKIDEVGLSPGDIVHFGRIRVVFKRAGDPTPERDTAPALRKVDSGDLKGMRRGSGVGLMLVLLLLAGGAAGYFLYFQPKQGGGAAGSNARQPLAVAGNLLSGHDADFEGELSWDLQVSGSGFAPQTGRSRAHSGRMSLGAAYATDQAEAGASSARHALARGPEISVVGGSALQAVAHLRTEGNARAALRLRFWSSDENLPRMICTGTTPAQMTEGFQKLEYTCAVPKGYDRAAVELLALFGAEDDAVQADDLALLRQGDASPIDIQTAGAQLVAGAGAAFTLEAPNQLIITGIQPVVTDPALLELQRAGLLCLSDAGGALQLSEEKKLLRLEVSGDSVSGLRLIMPTVIGAGGVMVRKAQENFRSQGASFEVAEVDQLLLGSGPTRMLLRLASPASVKAQGRADRFELALTAVRSLSIQTGFADERRQASDQLRLANQELRENKYKSVLDRLQQIIQQLPHDNALLGRARTLRQQVLERLEARLQDLEASFNEALFFRSLAGYRRVERGLNRLVESFGRKHLPDAKLIDARLERSRKAIVAAEQEAGQADAKKLTVLAQAYEAGGSDSDKAFAAIIRKYIKQHLPAVGQNQEGK